MTLYGMVLNSTVVVQKTMSFFGAKKRTRSIDSVLAHFPKLFTNATEHSISLQQVQQKRKQTMTFWWGEMHSSFSPNINTISSFALFIDGIPTYIDPFHPSHVGTRSDWNPSIALEFGVSRNMAGFAYVAVSIDACMHGFSLYS